MPHIPSKECLRRTASNMEVAFHKALNDVPPCVSICIANYNGEHLLRDCIESILAQDSDVDVEILVHDDASQDGSLELLASVYPQVRVIVSDTNVGFCVANNRMAEQARGQYLLLLNNDAALLPNALTTLLGHARRPGPPRILTLPQYDWTTGELVDRGSRLDPFHVPVPNLSPKHEHVAYVVGACLWIPSEEWSRLGGLPEWMESIGEDLFLCAHGRLKGVQLEVTDRSGYRHRQGASFGGNRIEEIGLSTNYRRRYLSERNRTAVLLTCTPGWSMFPWALLHVSMLVAEGLAISLLKRSMKPWREIYGAAMLSLWSQRSLLNSVRRSVQANREIGICTYIKGAYTCEPHKLTMLLRHGMPNLE